MSPVRVFIVDDHPVLRQGVSTLLKSAGRIEIVGEAATGYDALALIPVLQPDLVILDAALPDMSGAKVAEQLQQQYPALPILVLSAYNSIEYVERFIAAGVAGYLLKEEASQLIINAVMGIARGEREWYSRQIQEQIVERSKSFKDGYPLTRREKEVLREVAQGKTNYAICMALHISEKTVEKHLETIYRKLSVHSRTEAVVNALQNNLI